MCNEFADTHINNYMLIDGTLVSIVLFPIQINYSFISKYIQ